MPKKGAESVTFQLSKKEKQILEAYCTQEMISKSTVLRAAIRELECKLDIKAQKQDNIEVT